MKKLLLALIIGIALFLRLFSLSSVPPSASLDEATIGWNAYSLLLTGHDEYGYHMPILLRAYDDFRPALYVYFVIPFVKLFGLTVFSVRLPSVLLSVITCISSYFLVKELLKKYQYREWVALGSTFLLAISPLAMYVSRLGHEVNPGLTFAVLGTLFFVMAMNYERRRSLLIAAFASFSLAFYTYQSEKVFIPLVVIVLIISYWKTVMLSKKYVLIAVILGIVVSLPIFIASFSPGALLRLKGTSVFNDNPLYASTAQQLLVDKQHHNLVGEIMHNRRLVSVEIFLQNYLSHFSPQWWVGNSGDEPFKVPGSGLAYTWELPFFLVGIFFLLKSTLPISVKLIPLLWIAIAFIAPGITTQAPHAMRSFNIFPMPQLLESLGIFEIGLLLGRVGKNRTFFYLYGALVVCLVVIGFKTFSYNYFVLFPKVDSNAFEYALGKAMQYVDKHKNQYQNVVFSNKDNAYQSYMFYLFYSKYNPQLYQEQGGTKSGGFREPHAFGTFFFQDLTSEKVLKQNTLYIANVTEVPPAAHILGIFSNLDGKQALVAFTK